MHRIAIFASGNGSNFEAIVEACQTGKIAASTVLLVCDNPQAYVIKRAEKNNIPVFAFEPKAYPDKATYELAISALLQEERIDLICLAGYMRLIRHTLLEKFEGRILNIHPSLLPSFKGAHAIDDAFNFGVKVFGVTVHLIDASVDEGEIIAQRAFEYYGDNRQEVEERIHEIEHQLYPEAIQLVLEKLSK